MTETLVSTSWVSDNIDNPDIKTIDATWHMPDQNRNAIKEHAECHIKDAAFF